MTRIEKAFSGPALIALTVAGDPDPEKSPEISRILIDAGADILVLGLPFTEPGADEPAVQLGHHRALASGTDTDTVFRMVHELRAYSEIPIVLFTYYNPVYRRGFGKFYEDAREAGADGIYIADMPVEESHEAMKAAGETGIDQIFMVAGSTEADRIERITDLAGGFIILGPASGEEQALVTAVRKYTDLPVVSMMPDAECCEGVISGGPIAAIIERDSDDMDRMREELHRHISGMHRALKAGRRQGVKSGHRSLPGH